MTRASPSRLLPALLLALLAAVAALLARSDVGLSALPLRDFVEYWAAGRLLAEGHDPYDLDAVARLEREAGRDEPPILYWAPPYALPFVLPLAPLPVRTAHLLWLAAQLAALVLAADLLWRAYGGGDGARLAAHALTVTFLPSAFALLAGQISPTVLLGLAGFLYFLRRGRDFAAGASCALLAIKPHLVYLFWPALLIWAAHQRRWRVLLGGAAAGLALTAVAMALRPEVWLDYWATLTTRPPAQYRSPTLGTLLRQLLGDDAFRWQFVPAVPGLIWLAVAGWRHAGRWDWNERLPTLTLVSVITATYGAWPFDQVVLLVPVVAAATQLEAAPRRRQLAAAAAHLAIGAAAVALLLRQAEYLWFIWLPPAVLAAYAAVLPAEPAAQLGGS